MARRKLKPSLRSVGHGEIHRKKLTKSQLNALKRNGRTTVVVGGYRKIVTKGKVRNGAVYWYKRSDGGVALRNFARDRNIKATRRAMRGRGYSGD